LEISGCDRFQVGEGISQDVNTTMEVMTTPRKKKRSCQEEANSKEGKQLKPPPMLLYPCFCMMDPIHAFVSCC
jgi:hypothetical protein